MTTDIFTLLDHVRQRSEPQRELNHVMNHAAVEQWQQVLRNVCDTKHPDHASAVRLFSVYPRPHVRTFDLQLLLRGLQAQAKLRAQVALNQIIQQTSTNQDDLVQCAMGVLDDIRITNNGGARLAVDPELVKTLWSVVYQPTYTDTTRRYVAIRLLDDHCAHDPLWQSVPVNECGALAGPRFLKLVQHDVALANGLYLDHAEAINADHAVAFSLTLKLHRITGLTMCELATKMGHTDGLPISKPVPVPVMIRLFQRVMTTHR